MKKDLLPSTVIGIIIIVIIVVVSKELPITWIFVPGVLLTFVFYTLTYAINTPNPEGILPLYLLAIGVQMLHFAEEYIMGFTIEIPKLFGQAEYSKEYWLIFNMVAYFVFIIGAIVLYRNIKELMMIPLFFIVVGVVLNTIGHIGLSMYVGGYFPGLYTIVPYIVIGPLLITRIITGTRTA